MRSPRLGGTPLVGYGIAALAVGLAASVRLMLDPVLGNRLPLPTFFMAVAATFWVAGLRPAIVAAALGYASLKLISGHPRGTLSFDGGHDLLVLGLYLAGCVPILGFGHQMRSAKLRAEESRRQAVARQAELASDAARLTRLQQVSTRLVQSADLGPLLREILDVGIEISGSDMGAIQLVDGGSLRVVADRGLPDSVLGFFEAGRMDLTLSGTASSREREVVEDVATDARLAGTPAREVLVSAGVRAAQSTPLVTRSGRFVGVFTTHCRTKGRPAERDLRLLDLLARQAADFVERVRAEGELRRSQEELRLALDAGQMGTWEWDILTGEVKWSRNLERIHGLALGSFAGTFQSFQAIIHPDDREAVVDAVNRSIERREDYEAEFRNVWPDGSVHWILGKGKVFCDENNRPTRMIGVGMNITQRKAAEQALQEANRRKDEFLAMLAHELRNPLAPIRNAIQILRLKGPPFPELQWVADVFDRQVQQLVRLVDDLLDVSRITRDKLELRTERVDLQRVVQGAVETSRPVIEGAGHELVVRLPSEPIHLEADLVRLAQIFSNLLNNAAKFTKRGGRIDLVAERRGNEIAVSVRDDGIGIPRAMLSRIFDLFAQVDPPAGHMTSGLGIGLTLAKRLSEMHGGSLEARSDGPGRGSEFVVRLPIAPSSSSALPSARDESPARACPGRRVLVVDDNRDCVATIASVFESLGYETRTALDGLEGLRVAEEFRPDAALLDIGLPKLDGYDLARRIRGRSWGETAVLIAMTGWGQPEDRRRAIEAGFDHHLPKPADPAVLANLVARATSGRPGSSESPPPTGQDEHRLRA